MRGPLDRLTTLTVGDVMTREVQHVSVDQSLDDAAGLMVRHDVSGLPVLNEQGKCVGVLSARDFVRRRHAAGSGEGDELQEHRVVTGSDDEPLHIVDVCDARVEAAMSPAVQSIDVDARLLDAARRMCMQHVHRMPVLDASGHLLGMLTSTDVVSALVNAVDERKAQQEG
jgi:CBS-domain-containing membrane protein